MSNDETKDTSTIVENNGKPDWTVYQRHPHHAEPEDNDSGADDESKSQSKENDPLQPKHKNTNAANKEVYNWFFLLINIFFSGIRKTMLG